MKNKYTVFLLYLCASMIVLICLTQIYYLYGYFHESQTGAAGQVLLQVRANAVVTLFLSLVAGAILFARERIIEELKLKAYTDVTGIKNKHACLEQISMLECDDNTLNIGLAVFDLNNLKKVNDFYGHKVGDELIQAFAYFLKAAADKKYFLGRFGGDEFVVIIQNCTEQIMQNYIKEVNRAVDQYNKRSQVSLSFAGGYAISTKNNYYLMEELLKEADQRMYRNKKKIKYESMTTDRRLSKILDDEIINAMGSDELTGLLNYEAFLTVIKKVIDIFGGQHNLAVICSDISDFRHINDTFGYKEGNNMLRQLAQSLKEQSFCLCASRIFSDKFAYLIDASGLSTDEIIARTESFNANFSSVINNEYKGSRFILRSGVVFVRSKEDVGENILNYANTARKYAKASYQNVLVYREEIDRLEKKISTVVNSFQNALQNKEFQVYMQAKIGCVDKRVCGAEALVRWRLPDGTFYNPDEFIPILEQTGDVVDMDFYVYEQVFSYLHKKQLSGQMLLPISLNLSGTHLSKARLFFEKMRKLLTAYPIPPDLITFELTESVYIKDMQSAIRFIDALHKPGFKVAMDDFGSGYSSLKMLKNMPFDEIKFDKEFMKECENENSQKYCCR